MSKIVGIDLGTGFSCVAVMEGGQPKVIFNSEGRSTTPSVVSFNGDERKVGDAARRQAVANPKKTVSSIKRFMGEQYDNVLDEVNRAQYKVVKGNNGIPTVDIDGKMYTPQEISAIILQKMKKTAEDYLGEEVTDAVITCPAYYDDTARNAVKDAGVAPEDITYINAHGTGTHHNDLFETRAIKLAFGDHAANLRINSTKSMIGHLLGAAGAVEFITCVKEIEEGYIHKTVGYETPDEEIDLNYCKEAYEEDVPYALSNSLGFGGHNASILLAAYKE